VRDRLSDSRPPTARAALGHAAAMELQRHDCPNCGAHLEIDPGLVSANCEYCGQLFHIQAPAGGSSRACLSCGFNNASDARYCNDCGQSLGGSDRLPQMTITVEAPPPPASQRKECPFCREDIAAAAIKCKHCDEYLDGRQRPARGAPRLSTAEIAREWAGRFFRDCPYTLAQLKPWAEYSPDQAKKIAGALRLQAGETGLAVLNETFWGSGKRGVVLTDQRVVWRIGKAKDDVSLSYLNRADFQYGWFKPKKLWLNKHELDPTYATQADLEALCELLQRIVTDRRNRGVSEGPRGQAQQMRRDGGGASPRAAGARDARAAFPDPQAQGAVGADLHELDVGALREQRVVFDFWAASGDGGGLGIGHDKDAMGVAHAKGGGGTVERQGQRVHLARERNGGPVALGLAHVDADPAIGQAGCGQHAMVGFDAQRRGPGRRYLARGDAAGGVAAGPRRASVAVPEPQAQIGAVAGHDFGQLVEPDAPVPVAQGARQRGRHRRHAGAGVEDDEIVAQPVHLDEGQGRAGRCHGHGAAYSAAVCRDPARPGRRAEKTR